MHFSCAVKLDGDESEGDWLENRGKINRSSSQFIYYPRHDDKSNTLLATRCCENLETVFNHFTRAVSKEATKKFIITSSSSEEEILIQYLRPTTRILVLALTS